ncbi:VOC family protein [Janibacter limosus]|uniref:VOC family protein n=1 Tax=Janibacter limosus TaxID=53458 RepID=A0A4P6MUL0_9MICO|nr:VOC family protein [Janibacter limosus]QBF45485.1 VOC family protein [Janibacter limosus]
MSLTLGMITTDTTDATALATWWARQTDGTITQDNDGWFVVVQLPQGPMLAFQKVADPTPGKNRMHLDLGTPDLDGATRLLLEGGASHVADHESDGFRWVTLADPDGNEFCIAQH